MANKAMNDIHRGVQKKYHTLCRALGLSADEKAAIVSSYGVSSSSDMDTHDLVNVCAALSKRIDEQKGAGEMDTLRKRAMAAIGAYLRAVNKPSSAEIIKGIACRATGYESFNKIPKERLRNVYSTFNNKVKDKESIEAITTATKKFTDSVAGAADAITAFAFAYQKSVGDGTVEQPQA